MICSAETSFFLFKLSIMKIRVMLMIKNNDEKRCMTIKLVITLKLIRALKVWVQKKMILTRWNCDKKTSVKTMKSDFKDKLSAKISILSESVLFSHSWFSCHKDKVFFVNAQCYNVICFSTVKIKISDSVLILFDLQ